jgi:YspA, cpYpsA-related SLOG family
MRVLVCGGRKFLDHHRLYAVMDTLLRHRLRGAATPIIIIHGGAGGADTLAGDWAELRRLDCWVFHAEWADISHPDAVIVTRRDGSKYDKRAGLRRNQQMIDEGKPDLVVAFPGGTGTADMVSRAKRAGIEVLDG